MKSIIATMAQNKALTKEKVFMLSTLIVNAGNYIYNLLLGRILGPEAFADAAVLITLLLILSFVGMTFQIVTAKYTVLLEGPDSKIFIQQFFKIAMLLGSALAGGVILLSHTLKDVLHTQSQQMFIIFGAGLPLYFLISLNRGILQGREDLKKLATTYQAEMFSRLIFTLAVVLSFTNIDSSIVVAGGILISLIAGLYPFQKHIITKGISLKEHHFDMKPILAFFALTAFYEFTQIIINNSDILLVKHYFPARDAGLYASLALIGRVVYFVAWMFVMMLLPKVIRLKKEGMDTQPILLKYVGYIACLSAAIILGSLLFPTLAVNILFGSEYISVASLLWLYALATSVFAIANIFAYYFLSLGHYVPVIISGLLGFTQIVLIVMYHNSLHQVVVMQVIAMAILLFFQLGYFFYQNKKIVRRN
ncbi:oligosaccharide flippase family protein [Flavobacterium psychrotrophum]|uniref:oligosaccharide flippase family protein n=1 Tax=Flavobacterium psychrotrophum TaxID=2294119 RepID=UPI000E31DB71|nr:oligosaccharide flippase family protein [Flavobacterium psychrotrophum]